MGEGEHMDEVMEHEEQEDYAYEDEAADPNAPMTDDEARSALDVMLSSAPQEMPTEKTVISRLKLTVTLRGVTERQIDAIGKRSERQPTKSERARGIFSTQRDGAKFNLLLVAEGLEDPDLTNRELLARFGPRPEDVVKQWFLPGEIVQMADVVMDLSGYSEEAVTRAGKS